MIKFCGEHYICDVTRWKHIEYFFTWSILSSSSRFWSHPDKILHDLYSSWKFLVPSLMRSCWGPEAAVRMSYPDITSPPGASPWWDCDSPGYAVLASIRTLQSFPVLRNSLSLDLKPSDNSPFWIIFYVSRNVLKIANLNCLGHPQVSVAPILDHLGME